MSIVIHSPEEDTCPYRGPHCECEKYNAYMLEALDYCIVRELEEMKKQIHCSFVLADTAFMTKHGFISERVNMILKTLWL